MWKFFNKMVDHITCPPCRSYNFLPISPLRIKGRKKETKQKKKKKKPPRLAMMLTVKLSMAQSAQAHTMF